MQFFEKVTELEVSLFIDDVILYIENTKESTDKQLTLISECSKITGQRSGCKNKTYFSISGTKN